MSSRNSNTNTRQAGQTSKAKASSPRTESKASARRTPKAATSIAATDKTEGQAVRRRKTTEERVTTVTEEKSVSSNKSPENVQDFVTRKLENSIAEQANSPSEDIDIDLAEIKSKFRKKKTEVPAYSKVQRFAPDIKEGLSSSQVNTRFSQFLFNDTNQKYSKSYASIFIGNLCTFFNLLCVLATIALIYSGASISQFLFVFIFSLNIAIGIWQEIKAKRKIDKLSLLSAPTAKVIRDGITTEIPAKDIVLDDVVVLSLGNQVPVDCFLAEGFVEVNESLLTGESIPVKKEAGDLLYAGSFISSGFCKVRADKVGKNTYLNTLSAKAKKYKKPNSELMRSTKLIIAIIGILIVPVAIGMFFVNWANLNNMASAERLAETIQRTVSVIIGMIPSGMLLLTSLALTVGILRLASHNTLVQDLYSLEMLARVNVLCLDKTGTITDGRMKVNDCMLLNNPTDYTINEIVGSCLHSLEDNNQTSIALYNYFGHSTELKAIKKIPFSSKRKLSAVTFEGVGTIAMGAPEFVLSAVPEKLKKIINQYASMGLRVLVVALSTGQINGDKLPSNFKPLAIISISDNIREDATQTIRWFKENDVAVKVISGDNPVTVSEVARRVGITNAEKYISLEGLNEKEVASIANKYTVFGRVTPEQKAILVKSIKSAGNTVAMTGDGVNDILALKEADCAVSVASGSEAAKNVSHLVLMDNNFASMPKVVYEGRRVINNIQNSSSLYLMKTLFTLVFAIISICMTTPYPFKTNNMLLLEVFVIGIPSFFLSLQPNTDRVKGKFLSFVIGRSVPGALVLVSSVLSVNLMRFLQPEYFTDCYQEIAVLMITFSGLVMLYRLCQPVNFSRGILLIAMISVSVLCLIFLPTMFFEEGYAQLDWIRLMFVACVIMLCVPFSGLLISFTNKLATNKKSYDERYIFNKLY